MAGQIRPLRPSCSGNGWEKTRSSRGPRESSVALRRRGDPAARPPHPDRTGSVREALKRPPVHALPAHTSAAAPHTHTQGRLWSERRAYE